LSCPPVMCSFIRYALYCILQLHSDCFLNPMCLTLYVLFFPILFLAIRIPFSIRCVIGFIFSCQPVMSSVILCFILSCRLRLFSPIRCVIFFMLSYPLEFGLLSYVSKVYLLYSPFRLRSSTRCIVYFILPCPPGMCYFILCVFSSLTLFFIRCVIGFIFSFYQGCVLLSYVLFCLVHS
jgi:hypothetical protein